uniref:Uncharacterized protein n=1 Tax=Fadolivirus 2 TaxID=2740747 RepID=A0A7D3V9C9_9VIRU|nr:hypothetical protein Fadolivirus_2_11 [Fadolivirus 2]
MEKRIKHLSEINPIISFNQWVYADHKECAFKEKLVAAPEKYTLDTSLVYYCQLKNVALRTKAGIPKSLISYTVYVCVCSDGMQIIGHSKYKWISDYIKLHPSFARYSPHAITYTDCHGDKCRRSFSPEDTGIWCTGCHGEIDSAYYVDSFIRAVPFNGIPIESILHIKETGTGIDWNDECVVNIVMQLISTDRNKINEINENVVEGGKYDQMIADYIRSINERRQTDKYTAEKIKNQYDGKIEDVWDFVSQKKNVHVQRRETQLIDAEKKKILDEKNAMETAHLESS